MGGESCRSDVVWSWAAECNKAGGVQFTGCLPASGGRGRKAGGCRGRARKQAGVRLPATARLLLLCRRTSSTAICCATSLSRAVASTNCRFRPLHGGRAGPTGRQGGEAHAHSCHPSRLLWPAQAAGPGRMRHGLHTPCMGRHTLHDAGSGPSHPLQRSVPKTRAGSPAAWQVSTRLGRT